jgi:hypothetical protein
VYYCLKNSTRVAWDHGAAMPNPDRPGLALLQILLRCQRGIHGLTHCIKHHFASFVKKISCSDRVKLVSERASEANFFVRRGGGRFRRGSSAGFRLDASRENAHWKSDFPALQQGLQTAGHRLGIRND